MSGDVTFGKGVSLKVCLGVIVERVCRSHVPTRMLGITSYLVATGVNRCKESLHAQKGATISKL